MKTLLLFPDPSATDLPSIVTRRTLEFLRDKLPPGNLVTTSPDVIVTDARLITKELAKKNPSAVVIAIGPKNGGEEADIRIDPLGSPLPLGHINGPAYLLPSIAREVGLPAIAEAMKMPTEKLDEWLHDSIAERKLLWIASLCAKREWDSAFFGFNVGFVSSQHLTSLVQSKVDAFAKRENIAVIEYLCDCHDRTSILAAEEAGYSFVDIRLTFGKTLVGDGRPESRDGTVVRRAVEKDIPALRAIAHDTYQLSRYYFDGHFDRAKLVLFYEEWIEKAVRGTFDDYADVLEINGEVAGFCSVKLEGHGKAHIGLFGLGEKSRGGGLGGRLLATACANLYGQGVTYVSVVTQGRNYAAQRLYQRGGFLTEKTELWYHKWTS